MGKIKKMEVVVDNVETTEVSNEQPKIEITSEYAKTLSDEELDAKIKELEANSETAGKELQTKKYAVKFENITNLRGLVKFLEKNVNWNHNTVPTYIQVYHGFKDLLKDRNAAVDENGNSYVGGAVIGGVYNYLLSITGKGYFEAKDYLKVLTECGGAISEAMKEFADDNHKFRALHTDLATLDQEKEARRQGIQVEAQPVEESKESK